LFVSNVQPEQEKKGAVKTKAAAKPAASTGGKNKKPAKKPAK
jgi:hypothetical protein